MTAAEKHQVYEELELEERIENYWDKRSAAFSRVRRQELKGPDGKLWLKLIRRYLPNERKLRILDAGTGAGFFAVLLAQDGHNVTGIDMSSDMLHEAKKNMMAAGCRAEFLRMSAQELSFPDDTFDVVISRNLTWTLPDVMEAYREWKRVLKPGGMLLNFDSDCGKVTFSKKDDQADVHAGIEQAMVTECNDIKSGLFISSQSRPKWDGEFLSSLGFATTLEPNIAPMVRKDSHLHYDNIPVFAICAIKEENKKKIR